MNVEITDKKAKVSIKHVSDIPPGTVFRGYILRDEHLFLKTHDGLIIQLDGQEYSYSAQSLVVRDYEPRDVTIVDRGPKGDVTK